MIGWKERRKKRWKKDKENIRRLIDKKSKNGKRNKRKRWNNEEEMKKGLDKDERNEIK